jgi:hypothetical protein
MAHKTGIMRNSVTSHRIRKSVTWSHGHALMLIVRYTAWHLGHRHVHRHALWTRHRRSMWVLNRPHTWQGHVATDRHRTGPVRLSRLTRYRRIRAILSSCYTDRWRIMCRRPLVADMLAMRHSRMLVRHFRIRCRCCRDSLGSSTVAVLLGNRGRSGRGNWSWSWRRSRRRRRDCGKFGLCGNGCGGGNCSGRRGGRTVRCCERYRCNRGDGRERRVGMS